MSSYRPQLCFAQPDWFHYFTHFSIFSAALCPLSPHIQFQVWSFMCASALRQSSWSHVQYNLRLVDPNLTAMPRVSIKHSVRSCRVLTSVSETYNLPLSSAVVSSRRTEKKKGCHVLFGVAAEFSTESFCSHHPLSWLKYLRQDPCIQKCQNISFVLLCRFRSGNTSTPVPFYYTGVIR